MTRWEEYNFLAFRAAEAMSHQKQDSPLWMKFKRMKEDAEKLRDSIPKELSK